MKISDKRTRGYKNLIIYLKNKLKLRNKNYSWN